MLRLVLTIVFLFIWAGTAVVFAVLAHESYSAEATELAGYTSTMPVGAVLVGDQDIGVVLNGISNATNRNAQALQDSIQRSAKFNYWLNMFSFFMACLGFVAQLSSYLNDRWHTQHDQGQAA